MGYVVLHLDKSPSNEARMTAHIARTQMPPNADPSRTHLNRELIAFPEGVADRTQAINYRLAHAGLTRKIGKNQVKVIRVMLTGSHDDMKRIEAEGKLDQWCADNLAWLNKTFGEDNIVSAVLHLDESTPHIHAAVVPIVTGERRKVKEKRIPDKPGKKKYRKKSPDTVRLCNDDVMSRIKLKEYQDTYAEAMARYGLLRGIDGSVARHISTQEFYRNAIVGQKNLQNNIDALLRIEEQKRQAVERLKQQEQEARMGYEQAKAMREHKAAELEATEQELKAVKGELKTEKLKSAAAEVGSNIVEGIGSLVGTSKVKRQEQQIGALRQEVAAHEETIEILQTQIQTIQSDHSRQLLQVQGLMIQLGFYHFQNLRVAVSAGVDAEAPQTIDEFLAVQSVAVSAFVLPLQHGALLGIGGNRLPVFQPAGTHIVVKMIQRLRHHFLFLIRRDILAVCLDQ